MSETKLQKRRAEIDAEIEKLEAELRQANAERTRQRAEIAAAEQMGELTPEQAVAKRQALQGSAASDTDGEATTTAGRIVQNALANGVVRFACCPTRCPTRPSRRNPRTRPRADFA